MTATPAPWLRASCPNRALEADLVARGWRYWHHPDGTVSVTGPNGHTTTHTSLRHAYEAARDHAMADLKDQLEEAL